MAGLEVVSICAAVVVPLIAAALKYQLTRSILKRRLLEQAAIFGVVGALAGAAALGYVRGEGVEAPRLSELTYFNLIQLVVAGSGVVAGAAVWAWTRRAGFVLVAAVTALWSVWMCCLSVYSIATGQRLGFIGAFDFLYNRDELRWVSGVIGLAFGVCMAVAAWRNLKWYAQSDKDAVWNLWRKDWWKVD